MLFEYSRCTSVECFIIKKKKQSNSFILKICTCNSVIQNLLTSDLMLSFGKAVSLTTKLITRRQDKTRQEHRAR